MCCCCSGKKLDSTQLKRSICFVGRRALSSSNTLKGHGAQQSRCSVLAACYPAFYRCNSSTQNPPVEPLCKKLRADGFIECSELEESYIYIYVCFFFAGEMVDVK